MPNLNFLKSNKICLLQIIDGALRVNEITFLNSLVTVNVLKFRTL